MFVDVKVGVVGGYRNRETANIFHKSRKPPLIPANTAIGVGEVEVAVFSAKRWDRRCS